MSTDSENIIASFEALPMASQQEVAAEILRRTARWDNLPISDDELVRSADDVFAELDRREAQNGP
jgi:hypothetical protein